MRNHNKAVLLRLTDTDYHHLKDRSDGEALTVQEFLRDIIRYGVLPDRQKPDDKKENTKRLDSRISKR